MYGGRSLTFNTPRDMKLLMCVKDLTDYNEIDLKGPISYVSIGSLCVCVCVCVCVLVIVSI